MSHGDLGVAGGLGECALLALHGWLWLLPEGHSFVLIVIHHFTLFCRLPCQVQFIHEQKLQTLSFSLSNFPFSNYKGVRIQLYFDSLSIYWYILIMNFRKINVLKYQMIKIKERKNDPQQNTYSLHVLMFIQIQIESLPPYLYKDKCKQTLFLPLDLPSSPSVLLPLVDSRQTCSDSIKLSSRVTRDPGGADTVSFLRSTTTMSINNTGTHKSAIWKTYRVFALPKISKLINVLLLKHQNNKKNFFPMT